MHREVVFTSMVFIPEFTVLRRVEWWLDTIVSENLAVFILRVTSETLVSYHSTTRKTSTQTEFLMLVSGKAKA